jgi:pyruvate,water dikinase
MVERGVISDPQQIFMLLEEELDAFLADPMSLASVIADRGASWATLALVEPPYIVGHQDGVPSISEWPARNAAAAAATVAAGDVLQGAPGAPGVVTGTARIILDPADAPDLQPTDIMVAPTTDPSWVPLFLSVAGIVVNVGAVASHAAIVSREVGVPCAVSVVDATRRIPDGATITVDGSTGAVTIVAL